MSDSHNYIIATILLAVAAVGIGGLYYTSSGSAGIMITGADTFQNATATFNVTPTINIQFKSFGDSNSVVANITPSQTTTCTFNTAAANATGFFPNTTSNTTFNLTNSSSGCTVTYSTLSEPQNSTGAFGVENLGNTDLRVNASDSTGCAFGESS